MEIPLKLTEMEIDALDDLCAKKGLNRQQLMLQALRAYQLGVAKERGELPELPPKYKPRLEEC